MTAHSRSAVAALAAIGALGVSLWFNGDVSAQGVAHTSSEPTLKSGSKFTEKTGEALFANVCRGCHMPDGGGATGAGTYPSLIGDKNLEASGFAVFVVVRGQKAMPAVGAMMSDEQVAAVVNYLRSHFGNDYSDDVTADEVKAVRP
jgi:mono/diheme cytochrome c family protein